MKVKVRKKLINILKAIEGLYTLKSIKKLLRNKKIKMPIIDLIYDIIINDKEPSELKRFLIEKE